MIPCEDVSCSSRAWGAPPAWLVAAGFTALLAFAVPWGFFGRIPTTVQSEGIVIRRSGLETVASGADGRIRAVAVAVALGDWIEAGDPVAELDQPDLELELATARGALADLQRRLAATTDSQERSDRVSADVLAWRRADAASGLPVVIFPSTADGKQISSGMEVELEFPRFCGQSRAYGCKRVLCDPLELDRRLVAEG